MWNMVSSNRVLDLKWKEYSQQKHLRNLRNIKSQVNTSAPKKYSFLYSRPKAKQIEFERKREIQSQNSLLVHRMLNNPSSVRQSYSFFKDSLNSSYNRKMEKQIDENNQMLVKKLQSATSQYSQRGLAKERIKYDKHKTNIAYSQMDPFYDLEAGSRASTHQIDHKKRPFSAKR